MKHKILLTLLTAKQGRSWLFGG